jgi:hypothetical protein
MHRKKIIRITQAGEISDFVKPGRYGLMPVGGVKVDPADHSGSTGIPAAAAGWHEVGAPPAAADTAADRRTGRHGDVLVVPLASPVRRLRLRNLARRSVSHLHARSVLLAVVLHYSDIWNRVPNRKELTIYRIEATNIAALIEATP